MQHLEELIDAGVPVYRSDKAVDRICGTLENTDVRKGLQEMGFEVMKNQCGRDGAVSGDHMLRTGGVAEAARCPVTASERAGPAM